MTKTPIALRKVPVQPRAQITWDAIVEAAAQVLNASGLSGFNTNAVSTRAGVSIGTLYQYFPNKDALMAALIAREQVARAVALGSVVDDLAGLTLGEGVARLIDAAIAGETRQPRLSRGLDHEEARLPVDALIGAAQDALDGHIARFLRPHFLDVPEASLMRMGRTLRIIARAVIDDTINNDLPDEAYAREQCRLAVLGYLDNHLSRS